MVGPLEDPVNVAAASEENKTPSADIGPKLSRYGRPIVSKVAEAAIENEEKVKDALYESGDEGNDSSEPEDEQDGEV
jgi:hypothetical protein